MENLEIPDLKNEATELTKKTEKTRFNGRLIGVAGAPHDEMGRDHRRGGHENQEVRVQEDRVHAGQLRHARPCALAQPTTLLIEWNTKNP
jgi:hypothetical protein